MTPDRSASPRIVRLPFHQSRATSPLAPGASLAASRSNSSYQLPPEPGSPLFRPRSRLAEPGEHVPNSGLPGFVSEEPRQDAVSRPHL